MPEYIEDADGAPYPSVYAVVSGDGGIKVPFGDGDRPIAEAIARGNNDHRVIECQIVPVDR